MNKTVEDFFSNVRFGEAQIIENMAMLPILYDDNKLLNYITLDKAIKDNAAVIKEVNEGGSVPELFIENKSMKRILITDGEELMGAKQNRIVNTTILLRKNSSTKIPVSCVERGRWNYSSAAFSTSKNTANRELRMKKTLSVNRELRMSKTFRADQGEVWREVDNLISHYKVEAPTAAMSEVFEKNSFTFDKISNDFKPISEQRGFVFFINGELIGFDYFSKKSVLKGNFEKVIKGYISDSVKYEKSTNKADFVGIAQEFFNSFRSSNEEKFKSVGMGNDFRYESPYLVGSALLVDRFEEKIIHFSGHKIK